MKYDLHIHTKYSKCSINAPDKILKIAKQKGLNGIAITDHHTTIGAHKVEKLNKDKDFEVIIGEEITTEYGDVLGLFLQEEIKARKLFEVMDEIKAQDGIIVVAHPFRIVPWLKFKYPLQKLKGKVDGLETLNSRNFPYSNNASEKAANKYHFAKIGSSDAHLPFDVGNAYTICNNLRKDIKNRKTTVKGSTKFGLISGGCAAIIKRYKTWFLR